MMIAGLWAVIQAMGVDEVAFPSGHPGGGSRRKLSTVDGRRQAHGGDECHVLSPMIIAMGLNDTFLRRLVDSEEKMSKKNITS